MKRQAAPATCSRIWETLLGRQPTDQERQELIRIRDTLNLPKTDPVWILLVALQYFHSLYKAIPGEIRKAAAAATETFTANAESRAEDALARQEAAAVQRMEQIVVENSLKVADNVTQVQRLSAWKWGTLATGFVLLAIMASLWWVKERAYEDGRQAGGQCRDRPGPGRGRGRQLGQYKRGPDGTAIGGQRKPPSYGTMRCTGLENSTRSCERDGLLSLALSRLTRQSPDLRPRPIVTEKRAGRITQVNRRPQSRARISQHGTPLGQGSAPDTARAGYTRVRG